MLKSFLGPLVMTFLIVIFVLMMQFLWLYIDELVGKGLSFGIVLEFIGWGSATLIPLALPLATLLASIMTMGNMGENNELLAMKAAGISLGRIIMPLICASVIISVGAFFISNDLIPVAWNKIYTLRDDIGSTKEEIKIPTGIFYSGVEGYTIRIEDRDKNNMMHGIMLYNHSNAYNGNVNLTLADSGNVKMAENKESMILTLYNGVNYEEENTLNYRDTSLVLKQIDFSMQQMVIPLKNYAFKKTKDAKYSSEVMTKSLETLRKDRDSLGHIYDSVLVNCFDRANNASNLVYRYQHQSSRIQQYKGSIDYDELFHWSSPSEEEEALEQARMHIDNQINNLSFIDNELFNVAYPLRRSKIESFRKFSLSLACLLFFFVGAPLGAIIRKGGLGTPVIISILFFVVYWVFDISGKKLANDAELTPFMGAFMSSFVLIPIGTFLTYKAIKDSAIFHADAYKIFFTRLKDRLSYTYDRYRNHFKVTRLLRRGAFGKKQPKIRCFFGQEMNDAKMKPKIVYMGTPEFAVEPLKALLEAGYEVAAVVTVPDRPSGRGCRINQSAVKKFALENGLPVLQPEKLRDEEFLAQLREINADMFVVVAFRMLPSVVWKMPRLGTFNLHASLLPQYRGAAPINWAIINGEKETGVTTFMLDEQIDTGGILLQERTEIGDGENLGQLYDRLMLMGSSLVLRTVEGLVAGTLEPKAQTDVIAASCKNEENAAESAENVSDETEAVELKTAPKINKDICRIDWKQPAEKLCCLVRGLSPYPAAWSTLANDEKSIDVKLFEVHCDSCPDCTDSLSRYCAEPGTIITDGKTYLKAATSDGMLYIDSLQLAGKRRMNVKEFLMGFRDAEKFRFVNFRQEQSL